MLSRTYEELQKKAGYSFRDEELLGIALTHASVQQGKSNNERLEFLGDRVLGLVVAEMIYQKFPAENEGQLAKRHAALVRRSALVTVAGDIGLASFVRLSSGEEKAGGLKKDTILADALEAFIGAIYIDGGFAPARSFVTSCWTRLVESHGAPPEDPKTALQEWAQGRGLPLPEYKTVAKSGSEHAPLFEIEVSVQTLGSAVASAASKRAAEKEAALKMLEKIGNMP